MLDFIFMGVDNLKPRTRKEATPLSFGVGEKVRTPYSTWYKEQQDVPEYTETVTSLTGDHTPKVLQLKLHSDTSASIKISYLLI